MTGIAVIALAGAGVAALIDRRCRRRRIRADLWAPLIDRVTLAMRQGHDSASAVLGVALHGPPPLRAAAAQALTVWRGGDNPAAAINVLRRRIADPRFDRVCMTFEVVTAIDGDVDAAVARLRAWAVTESARAARLGRAYAVVRVAAWTSIAPAAVAAAGRLDPTASMVAVVATACTWLACLALTVRPRPRVFATSAGSATGSVP